MTVTVGLPLAYFSSNPSIPVTLVGNAATGIKAALVSNGATQSSAYPEFQGVFGLTSTHGEGQGNTGNKVALYAGVLSDAGTGNTWGANFLNRLPPTLSTTTSFFQGVEIDLQNDSQHFGENGAIGSPGSVGLQITASTALQYNGGNPYRNNAGHFITGRADVWHYGIAFGGNSVKDATVYDFGHATRSLLIAGSHTWGIDFTGTISSVAIRGKNDMPLLGAVNAAADATLTLVKLDTNDQLILGSGVSNVFFANVGGGNNFETAPPLIVGSAVNRLYARGATTGVAPQLGAVGTDTDIDLTLLPKGAGLVRFGTRTAIGAETVTGYITIKDAGGTSRKLAVVS